MIVRRAIVAFVCVMSAALAACSPSPPASVATAKGSSATTETTLSTTDRLMAEARNFAYRVRNVDCSATGSSFAISQGIVTNRHVASGAQSLQISTWSGTDFNATVQSISQTPGADLAIAVGGPSTTTAVLGHRKVAPGTPVWAAGYPEGDQLSLTPGIVADYIDGGIYGSPGQIMELTNAVKPGSSGSPLLDSVGKVVGVVFALNTVTGNALAIPTSTLDQFLASPGNNAAGSCDG